MSPDRMQKDAGLASVVEVSRSLQKDLRVAETIALRSNRCVCGSVPDLPPLPSKAEAMGWAKAPWLHRRAVVLRPKATPRRNRAARQDGSLWRLRLGLVRRSEERRVGQECR